VVSVSETDDPDFIAEVNAHCVSAPELQRRGAFHGHWAELDDSLAFDAKEPLAVLKKRWADARPIVLHDALPDEVLDAVDDPLATAHMGGELLSPKGLNAWLQKREQLIGPEFRVQRPLEERGRSKGANLPDERDLARAFVSWKAPKGRTIKGPASVSNLWIKSQRLSLHGEDDSVRVRFSFGDEGTDDASRDMARHKLVRDLSNRLMPEAAAIQADEEIRGLLEDWIGATPLMTQGIAYWNAPNGGALFHHDAFEEPLQGRQRGVLYSQITGSTAWLALSVQDMVLRIREFVEFMEDGTLTAARAALITEHSRGKELLEVVASDARLVQELSLPGCGVLGPLVNYGPDFTSLCADAGHAFILGPGDVILLPNHGHASTCMHSVFCAGEEPGFALSLAIRTTTDGVDPDQIFDPRKRRRRGRPASNGAGSPRKSPGSTRRRPRSRRR
jgi:hypothetical protein